jgi:hypothetical protein
MANRQARRQDEQRFIAGFAFTFAPAEDGCPVSGFATDHAARP